MASAERIESAAVRVGELVCTVAKPGRHSDVLREMAGRFDSSRSFVTRQESTQGFLTSAGRFVNRREAAAIALRAGQITELNWPPKLYSEDLW